jgi:hypothetical protein
MKRTKIRQIGKIGRINLEVNRRLKEIYIATDIRNCELGFEGCDNYPLNYCHRHEREWYKGIIKLLASINQTLIGCQYCHRKIDDNKKLREEKFLELRGEEIL